jgi:hypothetical protein
MRKYNNYIRGLDYINMAPSTPGCFWIIWITSIQNVQIWNPENTFEKIIQ